MTTCAGWSPTRPTLAESRFPPGGPPLSGVRLGSAAASTSSRACSGAPGDASNTSVSNSGPCGPTPPAAPPISDGTSPSDSSLFSRTSQADSGAIVGQVTRPARSLRGEADHKGSMHPAHGSGPRPLARLKFKGTRGGGFGPMTGLGRQRRTRTPVSQGGLPQEAQPKKRQRKLGIRRQSGRLIGFGLAAVMIAGLGLGGYIAWPRPLNSKTVCFYSGSISSLETFSKLAGTQVNCTVAFSDAN